MPHICDEMLPAQPSQIPFEVDPAAVVNAFCAMKAFEICERGCGYSVDAVDRHVDQKAESVASPMLYNLLAALSPCRLREPLFTS